MRVRDPQQYSAPDAARHEVDVVETGGNGANRGETLSLAGTKSDFLANISHELRTPLNAIIGFSEIMSSEVLGPIDNERYLEYAQDIHSSGHRLLEIINEILDFSKIEAGEYEIAESDIDVVGLCTGARELVLPEATVARVQITIATSSDMPVLRGDESKIRQMLTNLLANAVKFTPGQGRVTIGATVDPGGTMTFAVTDTGIGIAAENFEKAMAPFGQVDSGLDRKYEGAGLGLPLARTFAEMHGASLHLASAVGEGTTVSVRFPGERVLA
jgi:signal transduction histidine kinase